jgi:NAD-dependent deacetylase
MPAIDGDLMDQAAGLLKKARSLFVLTGAGISAESGVPTFRGTDGFWKNYSAEQLATPDAFAKNPRLVWEWYHWRQGLILKAEPNPGHHALVEIENRVERFLLLTQNVDDLHSRAGSKNILQLHGNIFRARCSSCGKEERRIGDKNASNRLPKCSCGGLLRPDVVWFGELIPSDVWRDSLKFLGGVDLALICGTSGVVWPAAAIPGIACERGIKTIEINLEPTAISSIVDVSIVGKTGEILPQLVSRLRS